MIGNEDKKSIDVCAEFRKFIDAMPAASATVYRKAFDSYTAYAGDRAFADGTVSETILSDWFVSLAVAGLSYKTAVSYLNALSGLVRTAAMAKVITQGDAFSRLRRRLDSFREIFWSPAVSSRQFMELMRRCRETSALSPAIGAVADVLCYSMLNCCMPVAQIARLKRGAEADHDDESLEIVERNMISKRQFVFNLYQSSLTQRQLENYIYKSIKNLLLADGLPCFSTADATVRSYWAVAAISGGAAPHDVLAALGSVPESLPALSLCASDGELSEDISALQRRVTSMLSLNPRRWYAMRLRPRVKFADLVDRINALPHEVAVPELFYPCDEIASRTGKKIRYDSNPLIADVVFFRTRHTDIKGLFNNIGDIAWCYTVPTEHGNEYASIPKSHFDRFQRTIGHFTPDFEVCESGSLPIRPNERVVLLGGVFQGISAEVEEIVETAGSPDVVLRLRFIGDNGIDFRFSADSRMAKPEAH